MICLSCTRQTYVLAFLQCSIPTYGSRQTSQYRLLFPGENLTGLASTSGSGLSGSTAKDTVWALYARSMLLWHACLRIRSEKVTDHERARFASAVWREADAIEVALNEHPCQTERAFLYQGREYLFKCVNVLLSHKLVLNCDESARMYVSYEFRRFVPHPNT